MSLCLFCLVKIGKILAVGTKLSVAPNCPAPNCPAPNCPHTKLSPHQIVQHQIVPAPNCPTPNCPRTKLSDTKLSAPNCPAPNCPAPNCLCTLKNLIGIPNFFSKDRYSKIKTSYKEWDPLGNFWWLWIFPQIMLICRTQSSTCNLQEVQLHLEKLLPSQFFLYFFQ